MSPNISSFNFDNLFQTTSTERVGAEKPEAVNEDFAALFASHVSVYQPQTVKAQQKVENLTLVENRLADGIERNIETTSEFDCENLQTAQTFYNTEKRDEKSSRSLEKDFDLQGFELQSSQVFQPASDVLQIKEMKGSVTKIESAEIKLPEAAAVVKLPFELNSSQAEKEQLELPDENISDSSPKQQHEITEITSSDNKLPFPIWINDGEFEIKIPKDSKKINLDKEQKIEKNYKGEKQFEFEKKRILIPEIPFDYIPQISQPKVSANFQIVLDNFSHSEDNYTFSTKKIKADKTDTTLHENSAQTEIPPETTAANEFLPIPLAKDVEKISEQIIEPIIVLSEKTEKKNESQSSETKLNPEEPTAVKTNHEGDLARQTDTKLETETKLENFNRLNENPAPSLKKIKIKEIATDFDEANARREIITEKSIVKETPPNFSEYFAEKAPEQVVEPMIVLAKESGKANEPRTIKIKLNPEELGMVEISLESDSSGKLHAELKAETKSAEAALNQNITELQKALETFGWQVETLTVSCQTQNYSNSNQSEKQPSQAEAQYKNTSFVAESETETTENDNRLLSVRA